MCLTSPRRAERDSDSAIEKLACRAGQVFGGRLIEVSAGGRGAAGAGPNRRSGHWRSRSCRKGRAATLWERLQPRRAAPERGIGVRRGAASRLEAAPTT